MSIYSSKNDKTNYPSHLVSNEEKGEQWILAYCKAAWYEYQGLTASSFYHARWKHSRTKEYAMGNQPINKYKPVLGVTEDTNESWLNIDWSILPIIPKFRRIAINKLVKRDYNISATAIDSMAQEEKDKYFKATQKRILLHDGLAKVDPMLPSRVGVDRLPGDPMDLDELEMQRRYTYKHQMSIEMEQAIDLVLYQNDYEEIRKKVIEDLFDDGVAVIKEDIDDNGKISIRRVNPCSVIINSCSENNFKDKRHVGEVRKMTIAEIKEAAQGQFTEEQYKQISEQVRGRKNVGSFPANTPYARQQDGDIIEVLDLEFYSVNSMMHETRVDRRGNTVFKKVPLDYRQRQKNKYRKTEYKVVYTCKWIIGTNFMFDFGLKTNMKREKGAMMDTELSYHLYSPDLHNMKSLGIMEQLIPIADNIQIAYYRLQQAIAEARPKGIMIEMGALEDIPLGASGNQMTPMEVIDLFNKKGVLVYRKVDIQGRPTNYRPIEELQNGLGNDVLNYYQIIQNNIQMIRDITGLNEFTDGSTPDGRALTTTAKLAVESTNNSLSSISEGEKNLLRKLCNAIVIRIQDVLENGGNIEGYRKALGSNSIEFFKSNKNISIHEYGIRIEDKPNDESRARLLAFMQANLQQGLIEMEDAILIETTDNLKVAQQVLAYKIRKRKEELESKAIRQQQQNGQVQMQSAQAAEQAKQQTLQLKAKSEMELEQLKAQLQMQMQQQKYQLEAEMKKMLAAEKAQQEGVIKGMDIAQSQAMKEESPQDGSSVQSVQQTMPENTDNNQNVQ